MAREEEEEGHWGSGEARRGLGGGRRGPTVLGRGAAGLGRRKRRVDKARARRGRAQEGAREGEGEEDGTREGCGTAGREKTRSPGLGSASLQLERRDEQYNTSARQGDVSQLKKELADKEHQLSVKPTGKVADNELSWPNVLSQETGENVQERTILQKALFELEETNKRNQMELQHLDGAIARPQVNEKDYALFQALTSRRQVILDNIRDNDEAGAGYRKGMDNAELQIEMAMRDQVIHNQRESLRSLWNILYGTGLNQKQIMKLAAKQGLNQKQIMKLAAKQGLTVDVGRNISALTT
ncbi:Kinesin-like protein KIF19 [Hordeum vulgare]|nr:Kinesin-like protein KIF19 [Hordeum vulgare]